MSLLMRAGEIHKRPVVTMAGDDVAQVKDIVYVAGGGEVAGFTLSGRGLFAGPLKKTLPWAAVSSLGRDAVMIADEGVLADRHGLDDDADDGGGGGGDVLGSRVLTDDGTDLGQVVDVVLELGRDDQQGKADVVGYEVDSSAALGREGRKVFLPLPDTLAASSEHLVVPASAREFVCDDLSGFGAAVRDFRTRLRGTL